MERDKRYLEIILRPIRLCENYRPRLGVGRKGGISLAEFQKLYRSDPFYSWLGLDHRLMYAAHKAAGGMTSIYRQIGIGCESLVRAILQDELGLTEEESNWSYTIKGLNQKTRTLSLDARISLGSIRDRGKTEKMKQWIKGISQELEIDSRIARKLQGVVFEVRQGYKSKDSKRQNADLANAAMAYTQAYLPCVLVMSTQIDNDLVIRYRLEKWAILTGRLGKTGPLDSTYAFFREVIGYDLAHFFSRHQAVFHKEVNQVLQSLLGAK